MSEIESRVTIFQIVNPVTCKPIYVGQTYDMDARMSSLTTTDLNEELAAEIAEIRKYGGEPFFERLCRVPEKMAKATLDVAIEEASRKHKLHNKNKVNVAKPKAPRRKKHVEHLAPLQVYEFRIELWPRIAEDELFKEIVEARNLNKYINSLISADFKKKRDEDNDWINS